MLCGRYAVAVAVDIDHDTVLCYGIGACKIYIGIIGKQGRFALVSIVVPVNERSNFRSSAHPRGQFHAAHTHLSLQVTLRNRERGN